MEFADNSLWDYRFNNCLQNTWLILNFCPSSRKCLCDQRTNSNNCYPLHQFYCRCEDFGQYLPEGGCEPDSCWAPHPPFGLTLVDEQEKKDAEGREGEGKERGSPLSCPPTHDPLRSPAWVWGKRKARMHAHTGAHQQNPRMSAVAKEPGIKGF